MRCGVADATTATVRGRSYLRLGAVLRADLEELVQAPSTTLSRERAADLLRNAYELAMQRTAGELDRMPPQALRQLAARYAPAKRHDSPAAVRDYLKEAYRASATQELDTDLAYLAPAKAADIRRFLLDIRRRLGAAPADRGRTARTLLTAPFGLPARIGAAIADAEATRRSLVADFQQTEVYRPADASPEESAADLPSLSLEELAARFAPVFVQQVRKDAPYAPREDQIGRVYLTGDPQNILVNVDPEKPVVYWAYSQARAGRRRYDQLVYTAWYPSRPALSSGDVQAGKIDGVVVRVTLDHYRRPAVYEFVRACGCYHTLWVAEFIESAARDEFGAPTGGRRFAIEPATGKGGLFLPALVRDDGTRPARAQVSIDAGHHLVVAISPSHAPPAAAEWSAERTYVLEPYETLTRLPLGGAVASMFRSDGLVHDAGRPEGLWLAPTGMLSAGQPRQLGTMKIRMDAYDHDDPRLLEKNLRLPSSF
ncbi:MAG: hypothetical protein HY763_11580 [Planctomycetes bacterium]|nr:hypothetical protein [Planctomycetota bacterium]